MYVQAMQLKGSLTLKQKKSAIGNVHKMIKYEMNVRKQQTGPFPFPWSSLLSAAVLTKTKLGKGIQLIGNRT
jgi:hypothetical protein